MTIKIGDKFYSNKTKPVEPVFDQSDIDWIIDHIFLGLLILTTIFSGITIIVWSIVNN